MFRISRYVGVGMAFALPALVPFAAVFVISSVTVTPDDVAAGSSSTGRVTLDEITRLPTTIQLSNSTPAVATVPASVTINARFTSAIFPVTTAPGVGGCTLITAHLGTTATRSALLYVEPPAPSPGLALSLSQKTILGGGSLHGTVVVSVNSATPSTTVQLVGSTNRVTVPASVNLNLVEGGIGTATFNVATSTVSGPTCALITATHNGVQSRVLLKINPVPPFG